ncbi:hypothetical protein [Arthrobacter sp. N199823]|uniref:hypothetical protein n=1 Tax=Arthrobacter sp. N199823 TaxID=2058895 RepID=UPI0028006E06|nr:hypothetical protein [Arthrobacter sp. N199823]
MTATRPHSSQAEYNHRLALGDVGGVDDGANSGEGGATEHGSDIQRDVVINHHHGFPRHHGVLRKRGNPQVVVHPLPRRCAQNGVAVQEVPAAIGLGTAVT